MEPIIAAYEKSHPNIKIEYKMQSPNNFRTRLQTAIQEGNAPDIVRIHNTWLPMLIQSLSPAPSNLISTIYTIYYDCAKQNCAPLPHFLGGIRGRCGRSCVYHYDL